MWPPGLLELQDDGDYRAGKPGVVHVQCDGGQELVYVIETVRQLEVRSPETVAVGENALVKFRALGLLGRELDLGGSVYVTWSYSGAVGSGRDPGCREPMPICAELFVDNSDFLVGERSGDGVIEVQVNGLADGVEHAARVGVRVVSAPVGP